jgi:hypothetical protein
MTSSKSLEARLPELREFVKENDRGLYSFCYYLLPADYPIDELVLQIFRDFGDTFRHQQAGKHETGFEALELRIALFVGAWDRVRDVASNLQFTWALGRDTRAMKGWDLNLLEEWERMDHKGADLGDLEPAVVERLRRVDLEVRAPVVLRDILRFEDEEVVRILGIRWGVYRHRLHRGRLDFQDLLLGRMNEVPSRDNKPRDTTW